MAAPIRFGSAKPATSNEKEIFNRHSVPVEGKYKEDLLLLNGPVDPKGLGLDASRACYLASDVPIPLDTIPDKAKGTKEIRNLFVYFGDCIKYHS